MQEPRVVGLRPAAHKRRAANAALRASEARARCASRAGPLVCDADAAHDDVR